MITVLIRAISWFSSIATTAIIIRAIMSWIMPMIRSANIEKLYDFLVRYTEPVIEPFRRLLDRFYRGIIDFSPLVAVIAIDIIAGALISVLKLFR